MARPTQEAIETFTRITGSSESVALQKLEEYGGNLNAAVNAYFIEGDRYISNPAAVVSSPHNTVDMNNQIQARPNRLLQVLSAARSFRPSLLLDPNYRRSLLDEIGSSSFTSRPPSVSPTGGVMGVPGQFNGWNEQPYHPGPTAFDYDGRRTAPSHSPETQGNVSRDDGSHFYGNDIEEEMIQAAIEASRREDSSSIGLMQRQLDLEDDEFSRAISLSLQTAEQEKAMRELVMKDRNQKLGVGGLGIEPEKTNSGSRRPRPGNPSVQEGADNVLARSPESCMSNLHRPQHSKYVFPSSEWGGISSEELNEAVRIETELFGENRRGTSRHSAYEPHLQSGPDRSLDPNSLPVPHQSSSSVVAQRLLREQQDDEYLASLLADREKQANALKEAESLRLKQDESTKNLLEEEKFERWLAAKQNSLPPEPALDDENAVTLLVRMPDGSRRGRRFLKSDKLQFLFDFIDVGRAVKPGTYRVVRPYPRRAFDICGASLSLTELGLTSKQEALFLEFT